MISKFFIERPVLANVLAILMVVVGAVALFRLPVAQYPDIVPPTVQVTTRYPGASARTVIDTVALPIEQQVNGADDMIYMQSYAGADGSYTLTVTFKIGTDLNFAQVLVQNRVSSALSSLPQAVQVQGVNVQKRSTAILQIVTLTSPDRRYDSLYMSNFATIRLKDEIARLPGVGNATVFGAGQYSMRIWLDPNKMQARGLNVQDVIQSLQQQSEQVTAGQIGMPPTPDGQAFQYTLNVAGRLSEADAFADVIVKTAADGGITRVRDIGRDELGAQTYSQDFRLDGRPAIEPEILAEGLGAELVAADVPHPRDAPVCGGLDNHIRKRIRFAEPARDIERILKRLAVRRRRHADLAGCHLLALLLQRLNDVLDVEPARLHLVGIEPDAHGILAGAEHGGIADAGQPRDFVLQSDGGEVAHIQAVVTPVRRCQRDDLQDRSRSFLHVHALHLHRLGQRRQRAGHPILHQHLREVEIGADLERDRQRIAAVSTRVGLHVDHVVGAVDLLLDRQRNGVDHGAGASAGITGGHLYGGRHYVGILRNRQPEQRVRSDHDHQYGQHVGENGAL